MVERYYSGKEQSGNKALRSIGTAILGILASFGLFKEAYKKRKQQ